MTPQFDITYENFVDVSNIPFMITGITIESASNSEGVPITYLDNGYISKTPFGVLPGQFMATFYWPGYTYNFTATIEQQ